MRSGVAFARTASAGENSDVHWLLGFLNNTNRAATKMVLFGIAERDSIVFQMVLANPPKKTTISELAMTLFLY